MSKIKIKQISSDGQPEGAVLMTDGEGNNYWGVPEVASGANVLLGVAEDGSYTDSRYEGGKAPAVGLQPTTKVSTAIDSINEVLGLLLPTAPNPLSSGVLTLATTNTSAKAANGYNQNSLTGAPAAGATVSRTTAATTNTATLEDLGDGTSGTLSLFVNDAAVANETLTFTDALNDAKTTGVLRVGDNKWGGFAVGGGPAPEGFFQSFDSQVIGATSPVGLNHIQLRHSISGNTNVLTFVRDNLTANPAVSNVVVTQLNTNGAPLNQSGIPHYGNGATLQVNADATNLAGQTYAAGTILSMSGPGPVVNFAAGQGGLPAVLDVDTLAFSMTDQVFTIGGNVANRAAQITVTATNPNGSGNATGSMNLIVYANTPAALRDEYVNGPAGANTALRVHTDAGDTPASVAVTAWDRNTNLANAGYLHEAAIIGGVLRCDQTDYSTGYLPVGVTYANKDAAQYVTYSIKQGSKSSISVTVTGTYAGVWVALPGVSTNQQKSPEALNDAWWDGMQLYSGAGVPGRGGDTTAGCAAGVLPARTGTQTYTLTFGTESSSNATASEILVRFRLNAGQSITALSFA